ncbi:MAG: glycoside hydrolase family 3 N-terminal domain-containing protein [Candidatus Woesearchaeota archaeon]
MKRRDFVKLSALSCFGLLQKTHSYALTKTMDNKSLEYKIAQMIITDTPKNGVTNEFLEYISYYNIGGVYLHDTILNDKISAKKNIELIKKCFSITPFIATDLEGGKVNRLHKIKSFPSARSVGKLYENNYVSEKSEYRRDIYVNNVTFKTIIQQKASLLEDLGINLNFDPVLDLCSLNSRSYSSDPLIVSAIASELINIYKDKNILATAKHFPGIGLVKGDSHKCLPVLRRKKQQIHNYELIPFKAVIKKVPLIMISHIITEDYDKERPSSLSYEVITTLLRKELGYEGIVITDELGMRAIDDYYSKKGIFSTKKVERLCIDAVKAGNDILLYFDYKKIPLIISSIKNGVVTGEIKKEQIEESFERIILYKYLYSL